MQIVSIKKVKTEPVYDITVKNAGHYILENGVITHNSGLDYAASTVVFLSKSKNRDKDKKVTGAIITAAIKKGRLTVEETKVETLLDFEKGLDRYYGLLDLALEFGIVKKAGNKGCEFPDGTTASTEKIEKEPEKYFTKEVLDAIDIECQKHFKYGSPIKEKENA